MIKGDRRAAIMDLCPDGFEDELKDFIDDIESVVNDIKNELDITSITEIGQVESAYNLTDELCDSIY